MNGTIRTADGHTVLRFERRLAHRPEKVWRALTEARHISEWFPSAMQMDLAVGARIRFVFRNGEAPSLDGTITELDPPRVFAYTWGEDAWLRWEIRPEADGCLLVFTHTFDDRPSAASFAFGWQTCLGALEALLDERPAPASADYVTAHEAYVEEFGLLEGTSQQDADGWTVRFERKLPVPARDGLGRPRRLRSAVGGFRAEAGQSARARVGDHTRPRAGRSRALGGHVRPARNQGVAQPARPSRRGGCDAGGPHGVASGARRPRRRAARPMVRRVVTVVQVTATDGVDLAVNEAGPPDAPTIVCVHGYPDNSSAWDGVVAELSARYHVVTYDVRGAGRSGKPAQRQAYRLDQLAADLCAVVDAVSPDRAVHLLAHDWGSIQAWHAVTGEQLAGRVSSYTSVSGPSLDHTAYWMRSALRPDGARLRDVARQLAESAYILLFTMPVLPEWLWRTGVLDRGLAAASVIGRGPAMSRGGDPPARTLADQINGLQLYRANMPHRLRRPQPRRTDVPVQVLAPTHDLFVSPALQTGAPAPWASDLRVREIAGGHWVIGTRPDVIARHTSELIEDVEHGAVDPAAGRSYER